MDVGFVGSEGSGEFGEIAALRLSVYEIESRNIQKSNVDEAVFCTREYRTYFNGVGCRS